MSFRGLVREGVRHGAGECQQPSGTIAASSHVLAQTRHARNLIRRWAERIQALACDEAEPAWADKVAILGAKITTCARRVLGDELTENRRMRRPECPTAGGVGPVRSAQEASKP
jgi:hypothetical protein